jgi:hypothetical protein
LFLPWTRLLQPTEADTRWDRALGGLGLVAAGLGFLVRLRRAASEERLFWLAAVAGIGASAPFVLGDSAARVLVVGFPLIAFAFASGLAPRRRIGALAARRAGEKRVVAAAGGLGVALLGVCLIGPALLHRLAARPPASALRGLDPSRVAVCRPEACPVVLVSNRGGDSQGDFTIDRRQLAEQLAIAPPDKRLDLASPQPPFALLSCYDFVSRKQRVIVSPPQLARHTEGFAQLEWQPLRPGSPFFEASGWRALP